MDTQNTPIHIKLWHHDFWRLCFANLLLTTSVYMLLVGIPNMMFNEGYSALQVGVALGAYGVGIFLLGGFCSYWVQRYRRNHVCQLAIFGLAASIVILFYLNEFWDIKSDYWACIVARLVMGACMGVAQITLSSTLVIDTCESFQRTEANYITSWFSRLAVAAGPLLSVIVGDWVGFKYVFPLAALLALASLALVSLVKFPFKAPTEHMPVFSTDRFFLPQGLPLFINIVIIMSVVGMMLTLPHSLDFYLMLLCGLFLGILAEKYVFPDADLKSEVITGLLLLGGALLVRVSGQLVAIEFIMPSMVGLAIGIIGSRFLLFYIKLAKHCQRGTSVSSFFLAWELGISLGLFLGFGLLDRANHGQFSVTSPKLDAVSPLLIYVELSFVVVAFVLYNFVIHRWYMKHRNR